MYVRFLFILIIFVFLLTLFIPACPASDTKSQKGRTNELYKLESEKILVTNRSYRQVFEPYIKSGYTVFITSDAVLNAFHVLFKESIYRFEKENAKKLPRILGLIWERLQLEEKRAFKNSPISRTTKKTKQNGGDGSREKEGLDLRQAAIRRIQTVIAVSIKLMGDKRIKLDRHLKRIVKEEVEQINNAKGVRTLGWLGGPRQMAVSLDYSVFKPRGMYVQSKQLSRYFRAIKWLQSIPFQIDRDEELFGIFKLGKIIGDSQFNDFPGRSDIENFFKCYRDLWGHPNERDIMLAVQISRDRPRSLKSVREYIKNRDLGLNTTSLNKRLHPEDYRSGPVNSQTFYIISPFHQADTILLRRMEELKKSMKTRSAGLEICSALGSQSAREKLIKSTVREERAHLLKLIAESLPFFKSKNLYNQYFGCLMALLDDTESDAPEFMKRDAWKIKSCNTALFGWSGYRNAFEAKAKPVILNEMAEVSESLPPGFVEPDPEFFARLGGLAEELKIFFERYDGFKPPRYILAGTLRTFAGYITDMKYPLDEHASPYTKVELAVVNRSVLLLAALRDTRYYSENFYSRRKDIVNEINAFAGDIEKGKYDNNPTYQGLIIETNLDIKYLWKSLINICRRIEVIAHKQLRDVPLNKQENYFLSAFGEKLASVMFYNENTYRNPHDDAPAITAIYPDPDKKGKLLLTGTGRPRELLVLYPYKGREVLCRGAVLLYYELMLPGRISNTEWRRIQNSNERPGSPAWLKPLLLSGE